MILNILEQDFEEWANQVVDKANTWKETKDRNIALLKHYFYIDSNLRKVGEIFKISKERVRQIVHKFLRLCQRDEKIKIMREYLNEKTN